MYKNSPIHILQLYRKFKTPYPYYDHQIQKYGIHKAHTHSQRLIFSSMLTYEYVKLNYDGLMFCVWGNRPQFLWCKHATILSMSWLSTTLESEALKITSYITVFLVYVIKLSEALITQCHMKEYSTLQRWEKCSHSLIWCGSLISTRKV
jgi:hypothetical protein